MGLQLKAEYSNLSLKDMLNRIITVSVPTYCTWSDDKRHYDQALLQGDTRSNKRTDIGGTKMLCYEITSTTYTKLQSHCNTFNYSRARMVEQLILSFKHTPHEQREKMIHYAQKISSNRILFFRHKLTTVTIGPLL